MNVKVITTIVCLFFLAGNLLAKEDNNENEKEKNAKSEQKEVLPNSQVLTQEDIKYDSLAEYLRAEKKVEKKKEEQPSLSTMSFNIIFQMIYRFSFSEIFDSSYGGSDTESIQIMN